MPDPPNPSPSLSSLLSPPSSPRRGYPFTETNSTKWTISINGGGWCYDEDDCLCRSYGSLGTSKAYPPTAGCGCKNPLPDGSGKYDNDCNCIDMLYLDGASFSGYRAEPWLVPNTTNTSASLWFRGITNLDATLDYAFAHGLEDATEFVLTGGSAGGLSTFLHTDRVAARLKKEAPNVAKIRAAPYVGFFLDHDNYGECI